jgi:hypothetical protein
MTAYSIEFKETAVKKMMPPNVNRFKGFEGALMAGSTLQVVGCW